MTLSELATALKQFRIKHEMPQEDMAKTMRVSRTAYQQYEGGKVAPSILVIANLAEAKNVSIDYITGRSKLPCDDNVSVDATDIKTLAVTVTQAAQALKKILDDLPNKT